MVKAFFSGGAAGGEGYLVVDAAGTSGIELDPDFLFSADFVRLGDDLLLRGVDGKEILIRDYFAQDPPPPLQTAEGARLLAETVESLAVPEAPLGYAQADAVQLGDPIGEVTLLNGVARVQRPDGSRADLREGDPIFQGDIVATGVGSELGILFIDETVFSLSANARMVIDELIYNPGSTTNSMGVSLLQGTFVFVTGQVAPTGGMEVETPVGVIGIRGTTVGVQIATFGGRTSIANLTNPDTGETGSFTFSNNAGQALFSLANHFLEVRSASADPGVPSISSGQDIVNAFGRALNTAIQIQRTISQQQNEDDPGEQDPSDDQESQIEGEPLQAVQEANLTQEQIDALASEAPIETAAGPQNGSGNQPQSGGSSFASGLQPPAQSNPIQIFNSNVDNEIQGAAGGSDGGTPPPEQPQQQQQQAGSGTPPPPPTNTPPVVTGTASAVAEGGLVVLGPANLSATDLQTTDPALLTYTVTGVVNGLVLLTAAGGGFVVTFSFTQADVNAGRLRFAHDGSETTTAGFVVQASDPNGGVSAPKVVALSVAPVNDPPTAADDDFTIDEHSALAGNVLADNGNGADSDVDGGPLTVAAVNGNAGLVGSPVTLASGALLTLNANGTFDYDPNGQFANLLPGESDQDSFTYTISDGNDGSDQATVTITVEGLNLLPNAADDDFITDEDTAVSGSVLTDNGNGADNDPDGDPLMVSAVNGSAVAVGSQVTLASGALLTLNADGTFDYDPNSQFEDLLPGQSGLDSFTYTISDGAGGSDSATVTITIDGVNDAPAVSTTTGLVVKGAAAEVGAALLSAADPDHPSAADITFTVSGAFGGVVQLSGLTTSSFSLADVNAGLVTFLHDDSAGSTAGFSVVASDPLGGASPLTPVSFDVAAGFLWTNGGGDGSWDNPANWASNSVPIAGSDVTIAAVGPATFSAGSLALNSLTLAGETLNITGGSLATVNLAGDAGATLDLSGGTLAVDGSGNIAGFFDWTGGTLDGDGSVVTVAGVAALTGGPLTLTGGLDLDGAAELAAAIEGGGDLTNGGSLTVKGNSSIQPAFTNAVGADIQIDGAGGGGSVTLEINGAFSQLGGMALTSTGAGGAASLVVSGGPLTNQGSLSTEAGLGGTRTIQAELINEGQATFEAVTVISSSGADHSNETGGTLTVNADVTVNGAGSFRNSGAMTVASAATFALMGADFENAIGGAIGGGGIIDVSGGTLINNGTINPGSSPGILTIDGNFAQGADGVMIFEIAGPGSNDLLEVTGTADLAGTINVVFLGGFVPTAGQQFDFFNSAGIVESDAEVELNGLSYAGGLLGIQLTGGAATFVAFNGSGDAFVDSEEIIVGDDGVGTLIVAAGQVLHSELLVVGRQSSGDGTFELSNGSRLTIDGPAIIGQFGTGSATISGGAQAAFASDQFNNLRIGNREGSSGSLTIEGNTTVVTTPGIDSTVQVGWAGAGALTVQNGAELHTLQLESGRFGTGVITIQGEGTLVTASNDMGVFSSPFENDAGFVRAGRSRGSDGEINVLDGAHLEIRNGSQNQNASDAGLQIARNAGSAGDVIVDGLNSQIDISVTAPANPQADDFGPFVAVGRGGSGSLTVSNGGQIQLSGDDSGMGVAVRFGSRGDLDVLSGGSVTIDGGDSTVHGGNGLANFGAAGSFYSRASIEIGGIGSAIVLDGEETHAQLGGDGIASVDIHDGGAFSNLGVNSTTSIGGFTGYRVAVTVVGTNSQLNAGDDLSLGGGDGSGRASLTISNGGAVTAGATNIYDGGMLVGDGAINGDVDLEGGTLSPGFSPGVLAIDGGFLVDEGTLLIDIEGTSPGVGFDVVSVTGDAHLGGGMVVFNWESGFTPQLSDTFTFLTAASLTESTAVSYRVMDVDASVFDFDVTVGGGNATLTLTGGAATGDGVVLKGGDRADLDRGDFAADLLDGGGGDDTLGGAGGDDTLTGGANGDTFVLTLTPLLPGGSGADITIVDFVIGTDVIEVVGWDSTSPDAIGVSSVGGGTQLDFGEGSTILLNGTFGYVPDPSDFAFRTIADGAVSTLPDGKLIVGSGGDGNLLISDGALFESAAARISADNFSNGAVDVTGFGTLWEIETDDIDDAVVLGNDTSGGGGNFGYGGTLDISDGAIVRIAGDEETPFTSTGLIVGRGGQGSVSVTNGGQLELLDPSLTGDDVFLLLAGSGGQAGGVGELLVDGVGSQIVLEGQVTSVALGRNGTDAEASMTVSGGAEFELAGITGAFFGVGRDGADGDLVVDGGSLYIDSALDPALQLGHHPDSQGIATVENDGLIEISGSEAFLAVGRSGNGASPQSSLEILSASRVLLDGGADNANAVIGRDAGSNGLITVSGKNSELSLTGRETFLAVGKEGSGVLNVEAGGLVSVLNVNIGADSGGFGAALIDGLSLDETQRSELRISGSFAGGDGAFLQVGRDGQGSLNIENGALLSIDGQGGTYPGFILGSNAGAIGTMTVVGEGSEAIITNGAPATGGGEGFIAIGRAGNGSLLVLDGAQVVNGAGGYSFIGREAGSSGNLLVGGSEAPGALFDAGAVLIIGADFDFDSGAIDFLSGGTGAATVAAGATIRAGAAEGDGITDIFLGSGGTLTVQNGGTVIGDIENHGGILINGNSPGTASFGGNLAMTQGVLEVELGGTGSGAFDLYQVAGTASLGGGTLGFTLIDGYVPEAGDSFVFLTAGDGLVVDAAQLSFAFSGVAAGFDFALDFTDGLATVTVLNDAGAGDSLIYLGGAGRDDILGSDGDDYLDGGAGSDTLSGGAGADVFVLQSADAAEALDLADLITDFELGVDHLGLADGLPTGELALTSVAGGDAAVILQSTGAYLVVLQGIGAAETSIEEITTAL